MAICPFCEKPVALKTDRDAKHCEVRKEVKGAAKKEVMYSCPHCNRVLGFAFFMGGWATGRP